MSGPQIISTEADTERGLIDHIRGWTVEVTVPAGESGGMLYGRTTTITVTGSGVDDEEEFVTLEGLVWDEVRNEQGTVPFSWTWGDIEKLVLL